MNFFRQINKRILLLWSLLLSLSLLCAQGASLHVHNMHHEYDGYNDHTHVVGENSDNVHLSNAHSSHNTSHDHDGSEVDISSNGLLKNTHNNIFAIALFALFFTLTIFFSSQPLIQRCRESKLILQSNYLFSPPLRAPPQH